MLTRGQKDKLIQFSRALINQEKAKILIPTAQPEPGFWFGGGNLVEDKNGRLYLTGRCRNSGDSRTGLGAGIRGAELAVFCSEDRGKTFQKILSFSKQDLDVGERHVISIEGSALHFTEDGVELFVASEKANIPYPQGLEAYHKGGTGVWTVDRLFAKSVEELQDASVSMIFESPDPRFLHIKDPAVYDRLNGGTMVLLSTHPFNWASSNTAYTVRRQHSDTFETPNHTFFPRGFTWDVAISRITCLLRVPQIGEFANTEPIVLAFYDGGECMRKLEGHERGVKHPRGYSCEEISGVAWALERDLSTIERLSVNEPFFVSPYGLGTSRYIDVLPTGEGFYTTWQQSQADYSQPLVMNVLNRQEAEEILTL